MKICAYVLDKYAKQTYAHESHDIRAWPGFEMVLHAARQAGYVIEYAGRATVHKYDVVLVSITSDCDWWPFIAERVTWQPGNYCVVAGGAGVLNVRPFLSHVNAFVFGRAESLVVDLLKAHERGERIASDSVCWSDSFSATSIYTIKQTDKPYPHPVVLTNGKQFREGSIGCPNKCLFCGYTWQRKYIGDGTYSAGVESMASGNRERTIIDLLKIDPVHWQDDAPLRIVGLDGMSERLRFAVNKRISRDMFREFLRGLSKIQKPHQVKVYCIIGYPTETQDDWCEFLEDLCDVDKSLPKGKQWSILLCVTPFRAMPATPAATWPMQYKDLRGVVAKTLKKSNMPGNVFFQGNAFWGVEGMGTDSLPSVIHSAICLRGTEQDADNIVKLAVTRKYWSANRAQKIATLEKHFDVVRLFQAYTWGDLPAAYLKTYLDVARYGKLP